MTPPAKTIETFIEEIKQKYPKGLWVPLKSGLGEDLHLRVTDGVIDMFRSLAHSLLEQTGNELIGEYEEVEYYTGPDSPPQFDFDAEKRNELRKEQRTKLTQLLTALEKEEK